MKIKPKIRMKLYINPYNLMDEDTKEPIIYAGEVDCIEIKNENVFFRSPKWIRVDKPNQVVCGEYMPLSSVRKLEPLGIHAKLVTSDLYLSR